MSRFGTALVLVALAAGLGGCSRAIMYVTEEYPQNGPDQFVKTDDGLEYRVRRHVSKPKILVQAPVGASLGAAVASGATFGAMNMYPVGPQFQAIAQTYLKQNMPGCTAGSGTSIDGKITWEFEYTCQPAPPARR